MKNKTPPNDREVVMHEDDFIVSKTDLKGRIIYANRVFMHIAGYEEHEVLGLQHNLVRHPDMPRAIFHYMWETLQKGEEFFGYVKNMTKDGGFYWTFANATPTFDKNHEVIGYYSVRRKPSTQAIRTVSEVYKEMRELEKRAGELDPFDWTVNGLR